MSQIITNLRPSIRNLSGGQYRRVFKTANWAHFQPGNSYIDGAKTRDADNPSIPAGGSNDVKWLRPGLVLGRVTSGGALANSFIGESGITGALTGASTTMTLTAAAATELVRRQGASGTFKLRGAPTAGGTVRTVTVTYSAVNTTTGVVTFTAIGVADVWTLTAAAGQDGGTYQLKVTIGGVSQTSAFLAANAVSATVDAALEALTIIGAGGVAAVYSDPVLTLTFISNLGPVTVEVVNDTTNDGGVFEGGFVAVHTTTGVDGRFVIGSMPQPTDGSETPLTIIPDGYPMQVADEAGTALTPYLPLLPSGGDVIATQLIPYSASADFNAKLYADLNATRGASFTFDSDWQGIFT